jgi:release factor glutamine methyltransferase
VSWTIQQLLKVTTDYLTQKGIESPRLSAEVLLAHQLNLSRVKLYLDFDKPLGEEEVAGFRNLVKRRLRREPLQYITGRQEFWSLDFQVGPQVLIPRPETEVLVEQVVRLFKEERLPEKDRPKILDFGTGCGAVAVALAREIEGASLWASDLSEDALEVARLNAETHGVARRIVFKRGDLWEPIRGEALRFDVIVSNPPYVDSGTMDTLPCEVRDYEPRAALDGQEGGMFFIEKIISGAGDYLNPGGWVLIEMDPGQTPKALQMIEKSGLYAAWERATDYSRCYRVVMAQKTGPFAPRPEPREANS